MIFITVFLSLIVIIKGFGASVSLGAINQTLIQCEGSNWILINYNVLGVVGPLHNDKGIRATENSCAASILSLHPDTNLDVIVYLETKRDSSGILVLITDENGAPIIKYFYNRRVNRYVDGWRKLSFEIKKYGLGYINLFGYSESNEIVLVDSIEYISKSDQRNIVKNGDYEDEYTDEDDYDDIADNKGNIEDDNDLTSEEIDDSIDINDTGEQNNNTNGDDSENESGNDENAEKGSGKIILTTTEFIMEATAAPIRAAVVRDSPQQIIECRTIGPWVIALIVVASLTGLALVAISAYHLGKNKGLSENVLVFDDVQEPRSAVSIPRVRGVVESPIQIMDRPDFT